MTFLRRAGLLSVPLCFLLAGIGMLWLLQVDSADGSFFARLQTQSDAWIGAHVVLLGSAFLLLPAALSLRSGIRRRGPAILGNVAVLVVAPTAVLLAGQYAIDFVMTLLVQVGGDALKVHPLLYSTPLVNALFYGLPNLVFLALMLASVAAVWSRALRKGPAILLIVNWVAVLVGNLVHPMFQRIAITLLAVSSLPLVAARWNLGEERSA